MIPTTSEDNKLYTSVENLSNWDKNPRSISQKGFDKLKKQITKLGQYKPLLVTGEGIVIGGNMRLRAYKEMGIKKIWISIITPKDNNELMEYSLSDNDEAGYYDQDLMANIMHKYDIDYANYAVSFKETESLKALADLVGGTSEDGGSELPVNAISEVGKVYQLGQHRLMCGDSTKIADVANLMDTKKAKLVFTDPPYNVDYNYTRKFGTVQETESTQDESTHANVFNDNLSKEKYSEFIDNVLQNIYLSSDADMSYYIWFSDRWIPVLRELLKKNGFMFSQNIIWIKENFVIAQSQDFHKMFEPAVHGWKKGGKHYFNKLLSKSSDVWNLEENVNLMETGDVWIVKRDAVSERIHPTQKPIKLCEIAIKKSSQIGDIVLDLFAGSGSTLMACEQLQRICYTMELDPRFVDLIRKRYAKSIGKEEEWIQITPELL